MACALRIPAARVSQGCQRQAWRRLIVVGRDEGRPFLVVRHHRRLDATVWCPRAAPRGAGGGRGAGAGQHVQEELVEQSVLLGGDEEWLGFAIFGRNAVCRVVLLEVEQAACTKGMTTMALE